MAGYNNVMKAIESLNSFEQGTSTLDQSARRTEKMSCCTTITNGICSQSVKNVKNFGQILGLSIKTLLQFCDDEESDVRMVADESLNRIIKSTSEGNVLKIQFELYNEIYRNGNARTLRAALLRFGLLCHTIRPIKGKAYISNLIPCIVEISKRSEEEVIDTLTKSLPRILKSLGAFMTDKQAKTLLKAFYPNLSSSQAVFRRNSANLILATCTNCRKPRVYLYYALRHLIDTIISIPDASNENVYLVVGILGCLRIMIPHIDNEIFDNDPEQDTIIHRLDCLLQIYELSMRYVQWHSDHNVVNAALETLAQLLKSHNEDFISQLTAKNGISGGSRILAFQRNFKTSPHDSSDTSFEDLSEEKNDTIEIDKNFKKMSIHQPPLVEEEKKDEMEKQLDIGNLADSDVSLKFCCRYLTSSFLLSGQPGQLVPDKVFRVSVKSLALTCIANAIRLYPQILMETLEKTTTEENKIEQQFISDILLFADHSDPQLRGNVSTIIGLFMNGIYVKYEGSYSCLDDYGNILKLESLIGLLIKSLKDESSSTCRQTLIALSFCLNFLLESEKSAYGIKIINSLFTLVENPYFLVKISLSNVLSELPFITLKYLCGNLQIQDEIMMIFMKLLGDQDPRVRQAACESIVKFVKTSFMETNTQEDEIIRKASQYIEEYLNQIISINTLETRMYQQLEDNFFVNSLIEPFHTFYKVPKSRFIHQREQHIEDSLSIIIGILFDKLLLYPSKHMLYGCFETLNHLSEIYLTTLFPGAWDCRSTNKQTIQTKDIHGSNRSLDISNINIDYPTIFINDSILPLSNRLATMTIFLLCSDSISLDLATHKNMIVIVGNLISGITLKNLKGIINPGNSQQQTNENDINTNRKMWNLFQDMEINILLESLFTHLMRIINIYVHVIDNRIVQTTSGKSSLPSLPSASSLSPRKKFQSFNSSNQQNSPEQKIKEKMEIKNPISSSFKSSSSGKEIVGSFSNLPHYMKIYEILKIAHLNYNSTLDPDASQMYLGLLNAILEVLSQILEIASTFEARKLAEETLHYLETTLILSPTKTIQCVRQLLKSLFSTNLSARWDELEEIRSPDERQKPTIDDTKKGLYDNCFQKPVKYISQMIKLIGNNCRHNESEIGTTFLNLKIRRESDRKMAMAFRSFARSNNQKAFFASFIRIFESMVIKSLNQYTMSNCISSQCQVLSLLSQLVQFHVNYCLLDTDKTFIDFVLGQFPLIEESQIPEVEKLLPKIFGFLVQLSYEKYHTKIIIDIREIIKLCDGLMASEQPAITHCIPALIPVIEDIFLSRSSSKLSTIERQELDTTREYLMSMLLRLIEHYSIIELLAQCLAESRHDDEGEEKWRKWSRMTMDSILPALSLGRIRIESEEASNSLIKLFFVLSPTVFRPVDSLLKILFTVPPTIDQPRVKLERWIGMVNIILLSLISFAKEDAMLSRLNELSVFMTELVITLDLPHTFTIYDIADPLNATNMESSCCQLAPEEIISIFVFRVIYEAVLKINQLLDFIDYREKFLRYNQDIFLIKELFFFLQLCIHMFESGSHCKIANSTIKMINEENEFIPIKELNQLMMKLSRKNVSILTVQWIYLITLLGYNNNEFWSEILNENEKSMMIIDRKIVRQCAIILYCDYICENIDDLKSLKWLTNNHIEETINLSDESPVRDLMSEAVHRNSSASNIVIQAISNKSLNSSRPSFIRKILRILECAHESQSGMIISILIPQYLDSSRLVLVKIASNIACKKVEFLLSSSSKEEVLQQISEKELIRIMEILQSKKMARKHSLLVGLMNNLAAQFYNIFPIELDYCRPFDPLTVTNLVLDKSWFLSQVKLKCSNSIDTFESAKLLANSKLNIEDCDDVMMSKEFDLKILKNCIKLGSRLTIEEDTRRNVFNEAKELSKDEIKNSEFLSSIFQSARKCLYKHMKIINEYLPTPHNVYETSEISNNKNEYCGKFDELMNNEIYWEKLFTIIPAVTIYMRTLEEFQEHGIPNCQPEFEEEELGKFAILCLEATHWMINAEELNIRKLKPHEIELSLTCSTEILKNEKVCRVFGSEKNYTWICSSANTLTKLVVFWLGKKNSNYFRCLYDENEQAQGLIEALKNKSTYYYGRACLQMSALISWLEDADELNDNNNIVNFAKDRITALIIIISRQELVNSFVLTPPLVWKQGWMIEGNGPTLCHFPLLLSTVESNFLQDIEVLSQFIYRVTLLGWTSRPQFEEIWMALLSVLNDSMHMEFRNFQSIQNIITTCLAVQGITRLLIQTLMLPFPGNPVNSIPMHNCRDPSLSLQKPSCRRLYIVQDIISWKYKCKLELLLPKSCYKNITNDSLSMEHLFTRGNIERENISHGYDYFSYSQLSVLYLWASTSQHEDKLSASVVKLKEKRKQALAENSLDLDSCIRFLIELYTRWMIPNTINNNNSPSRLLHNIVQSVISISDLFVERGQFQWMFDTCSEMEKYHPIDNEILHHALVIAILKSASVLVPLDIESLEKIKKAIDIGLKMDYLPGRIATLHGILYLLQSAVHANCDETMNIVHTMALKYIQKYIDTEKKNGNDLIIIENEYHQRTLWALIFFLLEHGENTQLDLETPPVLELAMNLISISEISISLHRTIIQGLERLISTKIVCGQVAEQIIRIALERIKQPSVYFALPALRLLITCMYTEAADQFNVNSVTLREQPLPDIEPEALMRTIERTSAIFSKIKKGQDVEVEILCAVLPEILADFFPTFETLTKVIGEFLSPQQPHQKELSGVVFSVCKRVAGNVDQLSLLQDWVVFSLPNFIQSLSLVTSTWCLSCFFVSASTNHWLRALFPYVQSRIGKYEYEDKRLFCIAATDFYKQLSTEAQKEAFIESFEEAGKEPGSLFGDIVTAFKISKTI